MMTEQTNSIKEVWEMISLEKEIKPILDRITSEYNLTTPESIKFAIRQGIWEGMCKGKGWQ